MQIQYTTSTAKPQTADIDKGGSGRPIWSDHEIAGPRSFSRGDRLMKIACYPLQVECSNPVCISARNWQEALHLAMPEPRFVVLPIKSTGAYLAAWLGGEGDIQTATATTKHEAMAQAREKWHQAMESSPADLVRPRMAVLYRRLSAEGWLARQGEQAWEALLDLLGRIRHHLQRREVFGQFLDRFTVGVPESERVALLRRLEQLPS